MMAGPAMRRRCGTKTVTTEFKFTTRASAGCLRHNPSTWPVSTAALFAARWMAWTRRRESSPSSISLQQLLAVPQNDRQQAIEITRNAVRQLAGHQHLLLLPNLCFLPISRGDIAES